MVQSPHCSRRSMDRTQACGACNVGSIPAESTKLSGAKFLLSEQGAVRLASGIESVFGTPFSKMG